MIKNNGACDLEYAIKLRDLGCKQDSIWWWVEKELYIKQGSVLWLANDKGYPESGKRFEHYKDKSYSAYTCAELGELILNYYQTDMPYYVNCLGWEFMKDNGSLENAEYEADCRAKMLIYLIENKHMEVER